jgi:ribose-phosphate pyrophosphokinase
MRDYRCAIIADPKGSAWDFATGVNDYLVQKERKSFERSRESFLDSIREFLEGEFPFDNPKPRERFALAIYESMNHSESLYSLNPLDVRNFPDNEFKPRVRENIRRSNCFFIHDSNLDPARWFTELGMVNQALKNSSAHEIVDVLPYLMFSRQDRKDESRVPITAKLVADVIGLYADGVLTMDVHNEAIQGFYDISFDSLPPYPTLMRTLENVLERDELENLAILAPDEGASKKLRKYLGSKGIEIAIVDKYREINGKLGKSNGVLGAEKINGKVVLIPDDIISSGGTQVSGIKAARNHGAIKVITYGTHPLLTKGNEELTREADLVLFGDTVKQKEHPKTKVVSFIPLIGEAIYRINGGDSISRLFDA